MKSKSIKIILFISTALILSSCMMMGPGLFMTSGIEQQQNFYDPVCGDLIDTTTMDLHSQYKGSVYYFNSNECMNSFKENPRDYLSTNNNYPMNYFLWGMGGIGMAALMILMIL